MKRKKDSGFGTSEYISTIHFKKVNFTAPTLTLADIELHCTNIVWPILGPLLGIGCLIPFILWLCDSEIGATISRRLLIVATIGGIICFLGVASSIKDNLERRRKLKHNEYIVVRAAVAHIYEDTSTAEGPDIIGDSYVTYSCQGIINKTRLIKIKETGTSAQYFKEYPKACFVFFSNNGVINNEPSLLFIGKDFSIAKDVNVLFD